MCPTTVYMCAGSSKDTLRAYVSFHAALRTAHQNFLTKLEETTRAALRQTLDAATSEFAVNLLASMPDVYIGNGCEEDGVCDEGDGGQEGTRRGSGDGAADAMQVGARVCAYALATQSRHTLARTA